MDTIKIKRTPTWDAIKTVYNLENIVNGIDTTDLNDIQKLEQIKKHLIEVRNLLYTI